MVKLAFLGGGTVNYSSRQADLQNRLAATATEGGISVCRLDVEGGGAARGDDQLAGAARVAQVEVGEGNLVCPFQEVPM